MLGVRKQRSLGWVLACVSILMCAMPTSAQQVFKCVNEHGRLVYSDYACPEKARSVQIIDAKPNTLDMTEAREQNFREQIRREEELARQAYEMSCADKPGRWRMLSAVLKRSKSSGKQSCARH